MADAEIDILWDGDVLLAVDKPAGLATQAPPRGESLQTRLIEQLGDRGQYLAFPHRLDRPVSGIILVALRKRVARLLGEQFAARKIRKEYLAVVSGRVGGGAEWTDWLRKVDDRPLVEICPSEETGAKWAKTVVQVVRYNPSSDRTLLRLIPETGRMHQLRIQTSVRGYPIVGDVLYGGIPLDDEPSKAGETILLRAHSIEFYHPRNGRRTSVTASDTISERV